MSETPCIHQSQLRRHIRFGVANRLRLLFQKRRLGGCGDRVHISHGVRLLRYPHNIFLGDDVVLKECAQICSCNERATVHIGARTTIGHYCYIYASESITIGEDCLVAPFAYFVDADHQIARDRRINQQPNITGPIAIGNDVWIGTGAKILRGVTLADGVVVAAGAVVNASVAAYQIVGGIPARVIGERR